MKFFASHESSLANFGSSSNKLLKIFDDLEKKDSQPQPKIPPDSINPPEKASGLFDEMYPSFPNEGCSLENKLYLFFAEPTETKDTDIPLFWKTQGKFFPTLCFMACQYLAIPATSACPIGVCFLLWMQDLNIPASFSHFNASHNNRLRGQISIRTAQGSSSRMNPNRYQTESEGSEGTSQSGAFQQAKSPHSQDHGQADVDYTASMMMELESLALIVDPIFESMDDFIQDNKRFLNSVMKYFILSPSMELQEELPPRLINETSSSLCWILTGSPLKMVQTTLFVQLRSNILPTLEQHMVQLASFSPSGHLAQTYIPPIESIKATISSMHSVIKSLLQSINIGFRLRDVPEISQSQTLNTNGKITDELVTATRLLHFFTKIRTLFDAIRFLLSRVDIFPPGTCPILTYALGDGLAAFQKNTTKRTSEILLSVRELIDWLHHSDHSLSSFNINQTADGNSRDLRHFRMMIQDSEMSMDTEQIVQDATSDIGSETSSHDYALTTRAALDCAQTFIPIMKFSGLIVNYLFPSRTQKRLRKRLSSIEFFCQCEPCPQTFERYCSLLRFLDCFLQAIDQFSLNINTITGMMVNNKRFCVREIFRNQTQLRRVINHTQRCCDQMYECFDNFWNADIQNCSQELMDLVRQDREWIETWLAELRLYSQSYERSLSNATHQPSP
ncbi:hypothetical protein O181_023604 [Austropuccinia psidii MF-1]|uniref:HAT C-terminal dimerisation domain-containing protein n=1 Tax=Austropuccinia psidii MF-1 TaxID=1389203 RepID=A0A9Q3CH11_9BASI|nr:hypothetical protein [Austropuccinia psidii MF-1]